MMTQAHRTPNDPVRDALARCPLFQGIDTVVLGAIAELGKVAALGGGELPAHGVLVVMVAGRAEQTLSHSHPDGKFLTLGQLGPGQFFGQPLLQQPSPRRLKAVDTDCQILIYDQAAVQRLHRYPHVIHRLVEAMATELANADQRTLAHAFDEVEDRLRRLLGELARQQGQRQPDGSYRIKRLTQQELAEHVGSTRETVSRAFAAIANKEQEVVRRGGYFHVSAKLVATTTTQTTGGGQATPALAAA